MNLTRVQASELLARQRAKVGIPLAAPLPVLAAPVAKHARHTPGQMNGVEKSYAAHLDVLKAAGVVSRWQFEKVRIPLAKRTSYVPDFVVVYADEHTELHEVKGRRGDGYWCPAKNKLKVKWAGELGLWPVCIVWPLKGGGWGREDFGRGPRNS